MCDWTSSEIHKELLKILPKTDTWHIFSDGKYITMQTDGGAEITFRHLELISNLLETKKIDLVNDPGFSSECTFEPSSFTIICRR